MATVEADAQTQLDAVLGTRASLAPGPINTGRKGTDLRVDISTGSWRLRLGYFGLFNAETGVGVLNALDPVGEIDFGQFSTDLTYGGRISEHLDFSRTFAFLDTRATIFQKAFPPGAFGGLFPEGVIDDGKVHRRQIRGEVSVLWSGFRHHLIRVGAGFYDTDVYDIDEQRNFDAVTLPTGQTTLLPLPTLVDIAPGRTGLPETTRQVYYGFLQDEWHLAQDWSLSVGFRSDGYSDRDFGDVHGKTVQRFLDREHGLGRHEEDPRGGRRWRSSAAGQIGRVALCDVPEGLLLDGDVALDQGLEKSRIDDQIRGHAHLLVALGVCRVLREQGHRHGFMRLRGTYRDDELIQLYLYCKLFLTHLNGHTGPAKPLREYVSEAGSRR